MTTRAAKPTPLVLRIGLPVLILGAAGVAWFGWRFLTGPLMSLVSTAWVLPAIVAVASVAVVLTRQPKDGKATKTTTKDGKAQDAPQSGWGWPPSSSRPGPP